MSNQSFQNLMRLRTNPTQDALYKAFYVDVSGMAGAQIGGPVRISHEEQHGITVLKITPGGSDYYFPYVRGVGQVTVGPVGRIPEGTIVVTGGMNGCALEVTVRNNQFVFYHDQNGVSMRGVWNAGRTVCRITEAAYWPTHFVMAQTRYPIVQFICVYRYGFWHVLGYGIYTNGGNVPVAGFPPRDGIYRGYFNDNIRLMQS